MEILQLPHFGWWSIIPPIIAIILALITKEVLPSLTLGVLVGALIYNRGNVIGMVTDTFSIIGGRMAGNVNILLFLALLGAIVAIVTKAGGSMAYGEWASRRIRGKKGASLATAALGCIIFIDDYFNCLTVGTVMSPVTDRFKMSRAKLAYIIDSTAAPVCIIAPISSWGASVASYISDASSGDINGMTAFVRTIPYNLYALSAILMVVLICSTSLGFGEMARLDTAALTHRDLSAADSNENRDVGGTAAVRGKVYDLVIPILSLILFTVMAMIYTGGGFTEEVSIAASFSSSDASLSLVLGSFAALVVSFFLMVPRRVLGFSEFMVCVVDGIKAMVPAFTILTLAWAIGGICSSDYLNTGGFIGNMVNNSSFPVFVLPAIICIVAGFLGFATGTSWGTMALLIPIGMAICTPENTSHLMLPVLGAILGGAVFGDHISPISDTTILSSTGAGCDHMKHVSSQLPYAAVPMISAIIGHLTVGIFPNPWAGMAVALILTVAVTVTLSRLSDRVHIKV